MVIKSTKNLSILFSKNRKDNKDHAVCTDYLRMLIKRGLILPINYFLECHLFDLIYGTNTHYWKPKHLEIDTNWSSSSKDGVFYMCSWSNEIRYWITYLMNRLKKDFYEYQFIDVGCGKGKPLFIYSNFLKKFDIKSKEQPFGIDYSKSNINIAKENLLKFNFKNTLSPIFINDEAINTIKYTRTRNIILYLYNPFTGKTFKEFIRTLSSFKCFIIYNNPIEMSVLKENNWTLIEKKKGNHPNSTTYLFSNFVEN